MIQIKEVKSLKQIKQAVDFYYELYKDDPFWVPPIRKDEIKLMNPEENPAFRFCDTKFWTAWKDGKIAGRITAIINRDYNKKTGEKAGRFSRVEFIDDKAVSEALFQTAEAWLKEKGMEKIHGPLGFTNLDTQGLLIEGFDYLPSIGSVYHKPYYKAHIEALGFEKENDWIEFRLTVGEKANNKALRGAALIKKRYGFEVIKPQSTKELQKYIKPIFNILNEAFADLPYVAPFNDEMIEYYAGKYFKVLNPKYVNIVKKDEKIVGFVVGLPSLSTAMQKAKGKLFPTGFYHIMKAMKHPEVIDLLLTGVVPEYQNAGVAVILFAELQKEMLKDGIDQMETTGIFETNHNVISNWKNFDHIQHRRRRCFVKKLS
jgi:GNAT superfamily N-acetyltransferase